MSELIASVMQVREERIEEYGRLIENLSQAKKMLDSGDRQALKSLLTDMIDDARTRHVVFKRTQKQLRKDLEAAEDDG
ncbi:hypothetical protein [Salibaculum sp.]|uniref:hypothetical protein n=1 Tax=Salibaculum sp. TaxID=2855480 RepID=UPI002B48469C|nr:hypothetical protein [Salibaculum sp.]HKL70860.1 hypothetical protein [Salibaculum sp.]